MNIQLLLLLLAGTLLGEDSLLVVRDPERHRRLRALLQPAFSADAIATYLPGGQHDVSSYPGGTVSSCL
jgi:cytochrome P450